MDLRKLLVLGLLALTGCAAFPQRPALIGYDPTPYGDAFSAAATEALFRSRLGVGFYEALQDKAYTLPGSGPCTDETLGQFFSGEMACFLLTPGDNADCREQALCIRRLVDPRLLRDAEVRSAIERALSRPCDALTPPDEVSQPRWTSRAGKTAEASWTLLRCGSRRPVVGREIAVGEEGLIVFAFALADATRGRP